MIIPKPILTGYADKDDIKIDVSSATELWLINISGVSYYLKFWGNGWVIRCQESYLCKDKLFKHNTEIPSFEHSNYGDASGWQHVFETKEKAVEFYRTKNFPEHSETETFYTKVYDILETIGGAAGGSTRDAFIYNFTKDKFKDREWRFQGLLGFGGKYRTETNRVDCYSEDETPERIKIIEKINAALEKLDNEK